MAGALRKTMVYLGLAEEDDRYAAYEEYDDAHQRGDEHGSSDTSSRAIHGAHAVHADDQRGRTDHAGVTHLPRTPVASVVHEPEVGPMNRITTIHPRTYNEAKTIGESFREGTPVIMNLTDMNDADAKRLVDFAAGLVFGLHGAIERVTSKVFLLSPSHVQVTAEESESRPARLFNQS